MYNEPILRPWRVDSATKLIEARSAIIHRKHTAIERENDVARLEFGAVTENAECNADIMRCDHGEVA